MKILHTVESYLPARHGMVEVVRQVSERLARRGHTVVVATRKDARRSEDVIEGVHVEEFEVAGNVVQGMRGETQRYQEFLLRSDFDVIANFAAQQWATDLMLPLLDRIRARKVLVPTGFSGLSDPEYRHYFEQMKGWMRQYDQNVFHSEEYQDVRWARAAGIERCVWIPNGAAADEFLAQCRTDLRAQLGIPADDLLILHVGAFTGLKGHVEATDLFSRARIRNATLLMVSTDFASKYWRRGAARHILQAFASRAARTCGARSLLALRAVMLRYGHRNRAWNKAIKLTALSRPDTIAAYRAADLFLFPSMIECSPIVLFECLASRTPFLTAEVGNAREIIAWSDAGALLPTRTRPAPAEYCTVDRERGAVLLEELCRDPRRRQAMAESGFAAWQERFTWEKISEAYERLYRSLVQGWPTAAVQIEEARGVGSHRLAGWQER